jgi:glycosyltransferase involved in cell wall biosynthesis
MQTADQPRGVVAEQTHAEPRPHAPYLTVVLPCLNEAETLATCIRKARACMEQLGIDGEVLVADNGSTDGSPEIARREGARVVHVPVRGYGAALLAGIQAARSEFVLMADADDSYDLANLGPFVAQLEAGADLVMGNRFRGGIAPGAMPPLHRYLGNPVLSFLGRLFFGSPCGDFHCGIRAFRRSRILALDLRTTGMEFASEMVVKATLSGLRIAEVPTTLSPDGRSRPPHLRTWRDGWRHLRFLLLYSPRWLFLYPGLALMALGALVGLLVLPGTFLIGPIGLDVNTLVFAMVAVLMGFKAVVLAVFARVFAAQEGLLPPTKRIEQLYTVFTLERGLLAGGVLLVVGLVLAVYSVAVWSAHDLGALDPRQTLRIVVPAVGAMLLGAEIMLASFFLSLIGLARR